MVSNGGGCLSGAIVLGHEHGGAYAIRPYTDVRQWRLTFIRPRNVFRLRRMPVGRYCSLPGTSGAYAFAPLHGRPTMADDVRSPPKCSPIAADLCLALLFSAMNMGGRMQYAPTRTSDNGRCRSFAPEMFSNTCARRSFASVENHFMGGCRSSAPGMFSDTYA